MFEDESALEMLNLKYLEYPNKDLVGSCFINGSDPQKRALALKIMILVGSGTCRSISLGNVLTHGGAYLACAETGSDGLRNGQL